MQERTPTEFFARDAVEIELPGDELGERQDPLRMPTGTAVVATQCGHHQQRGLQCLVQWFGEAFGRHRSCRFIEYRSIGGLTSEAETRWRQIRKYQRQAQHGR